MITAAFRQVLRKSVQPRLLRSRAARNWHSHNPASPTSERRNELIMSWPFSAPARRTLHDEVVS
eukprot:1325882-Pyramimonas_sp.AAC.1